MAYAAGLRHETAAEAEIGAEQRFARQDRGAGAHDVGEFGDGEQRLADVIVADVVGDDIDRQRIERNQGNSASHAAAPGE
jgi:hypothetical protein